MKPRAVERMELIACIFPLCLHFLASLELWQVGSRQGKGIDPIIRFLRLPLVPAAVEEARQTNKGWGTVGWFDAVKLHKATKRKGHG